MTFTLIGLFSQALSIPVIILFLSKGSLLPSFLTTNNSTSSTRSYVVKRLMQSRHSLRLRIATPSLLRRESITLFLKLVQKGHFIFFGHYLATKRTENTEKALKKLCFLSLCPP